MVDVKIFKTFCRMCDAGCGMNVYVEKDRVVKVEGIREHPRNSGFLCPKGYSAVEYLYSPNRLKHPLKKENGEWKKISWDEALTIVAEKLSEIKEKYGAKATAVYVGEGIDHQDVYHLIRRFCDAYGTPNLSSSASICFRAMVLGVLLTFGKLPEAEAGIEGSKCIMVWGFNPGASRPTTAKHILENVKKGAKLIVVDSRTTQLAKKADLHLQPRPGTDCALALSMMNVIISEKLYDRNFVERWTTGFDKLEEHVKNYPPEKTEKITWVPAEMVRKAARMFATTKPACILPGNALNLQVTSVQNNRSMAILQALTGNVDVEGGWITISRLRLASPSIPSRVTEKPLGAEEYPIFYGFWDRIYGEGQAMVLPDVLLSGKPYEVKAMIIVGANPVLTWPNSKKVVEALKKLDFLVVVDVFMTETAKLADLVFPACTFLEKWNLLDYSQTGLSYVMLGSKVVEPLYESRSDWEFWFGLIKKMGFEEYFPWKNEIEFLDFLLKPSGLSVEQLKKNPNGIMYGSKKPADYEGRGFKTPSKKVEIYSETLEKYGYDPLPVYVEPKESYLNNPTLAEKYPLILTTGTRITPYTHSRYRELEKLRKITPEPQVEIHPKTAEKYNIMENDLVIVETQRGSIKVKAKLTEDILPEVVSVTHGWNEANINLLTDDEERDPISGYPALKAMLCRVKKVTT